MPTSAPTELRMREEKEISPSPQSIGMAPPTAEPINTPPQISDFALIITHSILLNTKIWK